MKIETAELIAAAHVRELAKELKNSAWTKFALEMGHAPAQSSSARSMWSASHPIENFVPQAVQELSNITAQIRSITESPAQ